MVKLIKGGERTYLAQASLPGYRPLVEGEFRHHPSSLQVFDAVTLEVKHRLPRQNFGFLQDLSDYRSCTKAEFAFVDHDKILVIFDEFSKIFNFSQIDKNEGKSTKIDLYGDQGLQPHGFLQWSRKSLQVKILGDLVACKTRTGFWMVRIQEAQGEKPTGPMKAGIIPTKGLFLQRPITSSLEGSENENFDMKKFDFQLLKTETTLFTTSERVDEQALRSLDGC